MADDDGVDALVAHTKSVESAQSGGGLSRLSDVNITNSGGGGSQYSGQYDYRSDGDSRMINVSRCWASLFSYRNVEDYFRTLIFSLAVTLVVFMINLLQAFLIRPPKGQKWNNSNTLAVISLIAGCLAIANVVVLIALIVRPRAVYAGIAFSLVASQLLLYICEVIVYFGPDPRATHDDDWDTTSDVVISSVFTVGLFLVQCVVGLAMWRFYEFLYFNYDSSTTISLRSSLLDRSPHNSLGAPQYSLQP